MSRSLLYRLCQSRGHASFIRRFWSHGLPFRCLCGERHTGERMAGDPRRFGIVQAVRRWRKGQADED